MPRLTGLDLLMPHEKKTVRIPLEIPWRAIYARLGFSRSNTIITPEQEKQYRATILESASTVDLMARFTTVAITVDTGKNKISGNGLEIISSDLVKSIGDSKHLLVMSVTAGKEITRLRDSLMQDIPGKGVIADAVGSETAEFGIRWLHDFCESHFLKQGWKVQKRRYSPGYGDCHLSVQQQLIRLLDLEQIGITITSSNMLVPEKSVTALAGISY
jgi:hypothetical protein